MDLTKMREFSKFHFHKGHYLIEDNDNYKSLMNVKNDDYDKIVCEDPDAVDYVYTSAWVLLNGSCTLFALALYEEFGYEVMEIRDSQDRMTHVFCKSTYHGQDTYIDVRGVTTDFAECAANFRHFLRNGYHIVPRNLDEDRRMDNEGDKTGYPFAQSIVRRYRDYYDSSF